MEMLSKNALSIHNVQYMDTHDGYAYNFDLKLNGKKIAFVSQDGWGGPTDIRYTNQEAADAVKAWCKAQPKHAADFIDSSTGKPFEMEMDEELLMDELFGNWDEARQRKNALNGMKRAAKTKTLFRLKGDVDDGYRYVNAIGERALAYLKQKYSDQVSAIFNPATAAWEA